MPKSKGGKKASSMMTLWEVELFLRVLDGKLNSYCLMDVSGFEAYENV